MNTPQRARKFYNQFSQYEKFQKSEGWQIPNLLIRKLLPYLKGNEIVIDIGCGPGLVGDELRYAGWKGVLVGVDIVEKRLQEASQKPIYKFCLQADAYCLPFADQIFDMVVSSAMVGLTSVYSIQEMCRLVKSNGYFACIVGEIKSMNWCCKRFQEVVSYFNQLSNAEMIFCEDLGNGYTNEYDDEHYIYYLFRCN